ncbi:hypothetical protein D9M72_476470 [compost metagenome]
MAAAEREHLGRPSRAEVADEAGGQHDRRKRRIEREDGDEGRGGDAPHPPVLQRAAADAVRRVQHQRGDRRLDAVEDAGHHRHVAEAQVDPRQRDEDEQRGQHEQGAGHEAAARAVHEPADVGGQLLRLGAGQQHAEVQRMQEALLADPAPPLDQLRMHDRDLPGGPAETDEAELEPEAKRFGKGNGRGGRRKRRGGVRQGGVHGKLR